jgi:hypothetical protein
MVHRPGGYEPWVKRLALTFVAACAGAMALSGCVVAGYSSSSSGSGSSFFLLLPLLMFAFIAFRIARAGRRSRRRFDRSRDVASFSDGPDAASPTMLRAELSVLADDVLRLDPQVSMKPEARNDFDAAVHRYKVAQAAIDKVQTPVDLMRVQRVVDEATYAMTRTRATLEGRPPPPPPEPLRRPGRTGEPAVQLDERDRPVYVGSPASFHTGWFGLGGGLLGGLLLGPLMGGFTSWDGQEGGPDDVTDGDTGGYGDGGDWV